MTDDTLTVLVADDEERVREFTAMVLDDCEVLEAADGEEVLELISEAVDVVLLDRRMPRMNGSEALRALRNRGFDVPVAMVTAVEPSPEDVDLQFDDYLQKPVSREELREVVERLAGMEATDSLQRELSEKRVKRNVLRAEHPDEELAASDRYGELEERIETLEDRLEERGVES